MLNPTLQQLELHDEIANGMQTTAAAKMSLTQNRQQMILPFDINRVLLQNRQNDYINCSRIHTNSNAVPTALGKVFERKIIFFRIFGVFKALSQVVGKISKIYFEIRTTLEKFS